MTDAMEPGEREPARVRIVAITVDDPILGGSLRLELGQRRTVLVGRNGAGKSRILESLQDAAYAPVIPFLKLHPTQAKLEVELDGAPFLYGYASSPGPEERMAWDWKESCVDSVTGRALWQVGDSGVVTDAGGRLALPRGVGLLHVANPPAFSSPPQAELLRRLLWGASLMRAGVPRHAALREALRLQRSRSNGSLRSADRWTGRDNDRLIEAIKTLASWFEAERDRFDAVIEIGRRLQILRELSVHIKDLEAPTLPHQPHQPDQEAEVFVDGVNFGYLSGGTQRLIELVIKLVDPGVTVLLLEEPETLVHPGLLRRLLAELDALGPGKQVVISTHSPMVIDWTRAEDVRLVERTPEGVTSVRMLSADEQTRLRIYLDDDLALSDFMFSGAMD